ncbi:hypothetical protein RUND412_009080 [Rhizina undulata]
MSDTRFPGTAGVPTGPSSAPEQPQQQPGQALLSQGLKVAIPRLRRPSGTGDDGTGSVSGDKHRVSHACEPCRQRKTKACYREMIMLKSKVELYENLLDQLSSQVDSAGQLAIQKALQGSLSPTGSIPPRLPAKNQDGESLVTADVGSTGSVDHIKEDLNSENALYPTGYMGKNSEVSWIQRVAQQLADEATEESADDCPPRPGEGIYTTDSSRTASVSGFSGSSTKQRDHSSLDDYEYHFQTPTYHLDDLSVSISGGQVDPFTLPPKELADELLNAFFVTIHSSFPIVLKQLFMKQYEAFFQCFYPPGSSKRWLAMLNLMFAIGALYGREVDASWKEETESGHLKYFARARILSLDEGSIFEMADLQQVQVIGLAGVYLVASNQTNRAWNVIGLAIRYAQTLGLNLRNDVPDLDEVEKEMRIRMWYSLYSMEHLLCLMTGRPSAIQDRDCSVPIPRPIDEEQFGDDNSFEMALKQYSETNLSTQSSSSKLASNTNLRTPSSSQTSASKTPVAAPLATVTPPLPLSPRYSLNGMTTEVLAELYSANTIKKSWSDVQGMISAFELRMVQWRANLPSMLDFGKRQRDQVYYRHRMCLALQYHNARIIINRPCLCRLESRIPNESSRSRGFNRSAAATCVEAARESIALIPDEPNPVGLVSTSPWWCLLHYLVSAGVIIMVEIAMRAEHNPQQADELLKDAKKVVKWLRALAKDNIAAERSWMVLTKLLVVSAPKIGGDTSDVERDLGSKHISTNLSTNREGSVGFRTPVSGGDEQITDGEKKFQSTAIPAAPSVIISTEQELPDIFRTLIDPFTFGPISHFDDSLTIDPDPAQFVTPQSQTSYNEISPSPNGFATLPQTMNGLMFPTPGQVAVPEHLHGGEDFGDPQQRRHSHHENSTQSTYPGHEQGWGLEDGFGMVGGFAGGYEVPEGGAMNGRPTKRARDASDSYS